MKLGSDMWRLKEKEWKEFTAVHHRNVFLLRASNSAAPPLLIWETSPHVLLIFPTNCPAANSCSAPPFKLWNKGNALFSGGLDHVFFLLTHQSSVIIKHSKSFYMFHAFAGCIFSNNFFLLLKLTECTENVCDDIFHGYDVKNTDSAYRETRKVFRFILNK